MDIIRTRACCFSGHRPEKLRLPEVELKAMLGQQIDEAIADGYDTFISGMARGVDICAAEEVIARLGAGVRLVCAFPYSGSHLKFREEWRERAVEVARRAEMCIDVSNRFYRACYRKRNTWMVNNSSRLIAAYDGTLGGTYSTIVYALEKGLDVRVIMLDAFARPEEEK